MLVVGFNWPPGHDHSVAAILDGKLIFASEEERYTRHKHSVGESSLRSLVALYKFLKTNYNLTPSDVDAYAVNYDPKLFSHVDRCNQTFFNTIGSLIINRVLNPKGKIYRIGMDLVMSRALLYCNYVKYAEELVKSAAEKAGFPAPSKIKIYPVRHHLAHAASAYYFSGFNSAVAVTIDGYGEYEATVIWKVKDGEFEPLFSISLGSIGLLWESISENLGYEHLEGPGKLMGLAPYGEGGMFLNKFYEIFDLEDKDYPYKLKSKDKKGFLEGSYDFQTRIHRKIADYITGGKIEWNPRGELDQRAVNIAHDLQTFTDQVVVRIGEWAKKNANSDKIVLAGGVALNAKSNMELYNSRIFNDMFIFPAANDAGTPIGAAAYVYEHVLGGKMTNQRLQDVYLGPEYSDDEVKKAIERSKLKAEYIGDDVAQVAELVAKGKIVTWYQGRAEFGPRALGHRSILADPTRKEYWRLVNDIKGREWWRPLAPSLLLEDAGEYFADPTHHPFMILMFRFKDREACERVPVVCHVDMTARPQTVTGQEDRNWYNVIKAFKEIKGEGLIMNTSFNLAGEPLVETPQDAIRSFALGGFDAMYMQGWLIKKG